LKQTFDGRHTVIKYLLNELSADDQARFKDACLSDGSLYEQVRALEEELIDDCVRERL
jgi:hypothetical protein